MAKLTLFITIFILFFYISSFKTPPQRILFVGDSLTCYTSGWQHQVATYKGNQYINLASGGKRLDWMKYTLDNYLKKDSIFSTVIIYGGCNDAFSQVDLKKSLKFTQDMIDSCNRRRIKPVVIIGFDASKVIKKTVYSDDITTKSRNRYAQLQKLMQDSLKNCLIIPICPDFTYEDTADGIHFKASGHRKIANWVLKHI